MITIDPLLLAAMSAQNRRPFGRAEIDWNDTGSPVDESYYLVSIEVERKINEPLGGVALGQADVEFINLNDRYTPV